MERHTIAQLFPEYGPDYLKFAQELVADLRGTAIDWPSNEFDVLIRTDPTEGMRQYWTELIGRAYIASSATIVRQMQWIAGMITSYETSALLPFTGSLRGLLEATADSLHALQFVPTTLAGHSEEISRALRGKSKKLVLSEEIENSLIHFQYARKLKKGERREIVPEALSARRYLDVLLKFSPRLEPLYYELCECVHSGQKSVSWMIDAREGVPWKMQFTGPESAQIEIQRITTEYSDSIADLVKGGFHASVTTLKVLRFFDIPALKLEFMDRHSLRGINAWDQVKGRLASG